MKVVLVGINSKYIHSNLAIRYLKAYTRELNYECLIREFTINDKFERVVEELIIEKADILAFSCYIWNIEFIKRVVVTIKLINPDIEIIYGGPEVSYNCKTFLNKNDGEYLIEGEGEETFKELIEYKLNLKDIEDIKGLYYKKNGEVLYNGKRELMDIGKVVFPYTEKDNFKNKIVYYEASRGCPFSCKYCLSSTSHGVRFLDIERVKKELQFLSDKKVKLVKFVDRTFNCNSNFAIEIWRYLIDMDTETTFHFEISADILTSDEIELLASAPEGRFQFEVGVQTTNKDVLKNINRHVNYDDIKTKVIELQKFGNIKQHLDLIAGLPGEDFESFKKSFNDVYSIKPEEIQLGFLKLLKGTDMRKESDKWGMVYSPYPPYEILKTNHISYKEIIILKRIEKMIDKYYNSGKFENILNYFMDKFETPFDFYYSLGNFCYRKGYLSRNISAVYYYKIFLEFNEEHLKDKNDILREIIKYDYLKYNKKRWLPKFLHRDINKEVERSIKKFFKNSNINFEGNIHVECFNINMLKYINDNQIEKGKFYLVFDEKNANRIFSVDQYMCI